MVLVVFLACLFKGGVPRLYWAPLSALITLLAAFSVIAANHFWIEPVRRPSVDVPLILLMGWMILSSAFSVNQEQAVFESLRFLCVAMIYFLAAKTATSSQPAKLLVFSLVAIGVLNAAYGLGAYLAQDKLIDLPMLNLPGPGEGVSGTFRNRNHFASVMAQSFFLSVGVAISFYDEAYPLTEKISRTFVSLIAPSLLACSVALSLSRGAWVAFSATSVVFIVLIFRPSKKSMAITILSFAFLAGMSALLTTSFQKKQLTERLVSLERYIADPDEVGLGGRPSIWRSGLEMAMDHQITGVGWGCFKSAYPSYRGERFFKGVAYAHNEYVHLAACIGIPGMIFFIAFAGMALRAGIKSMLSSEDAGSRAIMVGIVCSILITLIHGIVDSNLIVPSNGMYFFALCAVAAYGGPEVK